MNKNKSILSLLSASALLWSTSCSDEVVISPEMGGNTIVSFGIELNENTGSRAEVAASGINQLCYEVYAVNKNNEIKPLPNLDVVGDFSSNVQLTLVDGQKYKVVFWAQTKEAYIKSPGESLKAINVIREGKAIEDAFTGVVEFTVTANEKYTALLTRPFAQVNIATTAQDWNDAVDAGYEGGTTSITLTGVPTTYNAFTGEISGEQNITVNTTATSDAMKVSGQDFKRLASALVLAPEKTVNGAAGKVVDLEFSVTPTDGNPITYNVPSAPICRNYRTNVIGGLLTRQAEVTINMQEGWADAEHYAFEAFAKGGEVTLTEDLLIASPLVAKAGANVVLNLANGATIKNHAENTLTDVIIVEAGATLTIKGEGTVEAVSGNDGYAIISEGVLNIEGGVFKSGVDAAGKPNAVIYARGNGEVYVKGGNFPNDNASKFVLNKKDSNRETTVIEVSGGEFENFNPANNAAEGEGTNFVKEDCASIEIDNNTWGVYKTVTTSEELVAAFKKGGTVVLGADIELENTLDVSKVSNVNFIMNGKTITIDTETLTPNGNGSHYAFIIREGGSLTIDGNGTIEATTPAPILFHPAGDLVIKNGRFIKNIPEGYTGSVGSMFVGTKPDGGWHSTGVTIYGGYFDSGYYDANAAEIEELLVGTKTLEETEDDIKKRGQAGDKNKVRVALKDNTTKMFNKSNNYFKVYGGTFVGANPAWGDEGCMLPTNPQYLRPWSYYQGAFLDGQEFNKNGIVLPEGYAITKGTHEDGRPIYSVTYNK